MQHNETTKAEILIHKVFAQTDNGRELLAEFKKSLIMTPTDRMGIEPYLLGKEEGRKSFIRDIINTIDKIEGKPNE